MTTLAQPPISLHSPHPPHPSTVFDTDMDHSDEIEESLGLSIQTSPRSAHEQSAHVPNPNTELPLVAQDLDMDGGEGTAGLSPSPWHEHPIHIISDTPPPPPPDPPVQTAGRAVAGPVVVTDFPPQPNLPPVPFNNLALTQTDPYFVPVPPIYGGPDIPPPPVQHDSGAQHARHLGHDGQSEGRDSGDDDDEDDEDDEDGRHISYDRARSFYPFQEDTSMPDDEESRILQSYTEHSALDDSQWQERTFFDTQDPEMIPGESGKIEWTVEAFNGTKENPRKDLLIRSPTVNIGGYDWRIKLLPHGNMHTDRLSVYVENVSVQTSPLDEWHKDRLPLPSIGVTKLVRRKAVAAQISVIVYNPDEPRVHEFKADAHQFHQDSSDHGWSRFSTAPWYEIHRRNYTQRQPLLRNDRLAVKAFIRLIDEPTACLWAHQENGKPFDSLSLTGLLPLPPFDDLAFGPVTILWLHFQPLRQILYLLGRYDLLKHSASDALDCNPLCMLQSVLYRMRVRKSATPWPSPIAQVSDYVEYTYDSRREDYDVMQAMSTLLAEIKEQLSRLASTEGDVASKAQSAMKGLVDIFGSHDFMFSGSRKTRLSIKDKADMQAAINGASGLSECPQLLTFELERQVFDSDKRVWKKLGHKINLNDHVVCNGIGYTLYGFATHSGYLQNGKYSSFVRPAGIGGLWYTYKSGHIECLTRTKAVLPREGSASAKDQEEPLASHDRSSGYGGISSLYSGDDSMAYVVLYARDDVAGTALSMGSDEVWDVPQWITDVYDPKPDGQERPAEGPTPLEMQPTNQSASQRPIMNITTGEMLPYDGDWARGGSAQNASIGVDTKMNDVDVDHHGQSGIKGPNGKVTAVNGNHLTKDVRHVVVNYLSQPFYEGEMRNDSYHGEGHLIYLSGNEYTGRFEKGSREGKGTMVYQNGDIYTGSWHDGQHHGYGTYTEKRTGNVYKGNWEDGKKHGRGTTIWQVSEEESHLCRICYCNEADAAFYDCGHVVACATCARRVEDCPVCRGRVRDVVRLFYT